MTEQFDVAYKQTIHSIREFNERLDIVQNGLSEVVANINRMATEHQESGGSPGLPVPPGFGTMRPETGVRPEDMRELAPGASLRDALRELAAVAQPGGASLLRFAPGVHGAFDVGAEAGDKEWAPQLLAGRVLRLVGTQAARLEGPVALGLFEGAGDLTGVRLEVWGCTLAGNIQLAAPGVSLAIYDGATVVAFKP